ncbi:MAG: hypothetical protein GY926_05375 [bacterium]|nr:hypothetical protein [bacterium]
MSIGATTRYGTTDDVCRPIRPHVRCPAEGRLDDNAPSASHQPVEGNTVARCADGISELINVWQIGIAAASALERWLNNLETRVAMKPATMP